jgi:Tol biopolymer transport system component
VTRPRRARSVLRAAARLCGPRAFAVQLAVGLAGLAAPAGAQSLPPDAAWRTFSTAHFRVTYTPELEPLARHAADRAESAFVRLAAELTRPPSHPIELVLSDHVDYSNAYATPFYNNRVVVFVKPPVDHAALAFHTDWLDMVIIHELVHIFHLDRSGRFGRLVRGLFGRVPMPWPVFPAIGTPTWSIEGLATYIESRFTGAGRVHGSFHDMVLRTAALEGRFDPVDRITGGHTPVWPGGMRPYVYGSMFMDWLVDEHGDDAPGRIVDRTASAVVPPFLHFDRVGTRALGRSFGSEYRRFRTDLHQRYHALADSLATAGLTRGEWITRRGQYTMHPRVSPDGATLAYVSADGRQEAGTFTIDLATGAGARIARRNLGGLELTPAAWLPGGAGLLYSQWEFNGPYRLYEDLYTAAAGRETRLTRGARLTEADVTRDGRIVAVQIGGGTNWLVLVGEDGSVRPLTDPGPDVYWSGPRWSPDGRRIAVSRWRAPGRYDVVVLADGGHLLHEATADHAIDAAPAWSPDGRWVIFFSDRSGISNLYAYDTAAAQRGVTGDAALRQITNVLTGAFHPDVSPDGRWIYYSEYHAGGFDIARMPFDTSDWRDPSPVREQPRSYGDLPGPGAGEERHGGQARGTAGGPATRYSAWPSARPYFWMPFGWGDPALGPAIGISSAGEDVVGRHSWVGSAALFTRRSAGGAVDGWGAYSYRGLGNPVLTIEAGRSWSGDTLPTGGVAVIDREDRLAAGMQVLLRSWRRSGRISLTGERVWWQRELRPVVTDLAEPTDQLAGLAASAAFWNYRFPAMAISPENGVLLQVGLRRRWDLDPVLPDGRRWDRGYSEASGWSTAYLGMDLPGFARHALAGRVSARLRDGERPPLLHVGGVYGALLNLGFAEFGSGAGTFLPVRGFASGSRSGTRAWSASAEYRFPLAAVARGVGVAPVFLDRISGALFADAGDAWCDSGQASERCADPGLPPLLSAGAETTFGLGLFYSPPFLLRIGIAVPVRPRVAPSAYLGFGLSF